MMRQQRQAPLSEQRGDIVHRLVAVHPQVGGGDARCAPRHGRDGRQRDRHRQGDCRARITASFGEMIASRFVALCSHIDSARFGLWR